METRKPEESRQITAIKHQDLPPEFQTSTLFGMKPHIFSIIYPGIIVHTAFFYYFFYLLPFGYVSRWSLPLAYMYSLVGGIGTTVGCHRYWTHKAFKAKMPLQILLMVMQTTSMQNTIFKWCRDHRAHHKYTDTDADPHNSKKGFWFSHIGWLMQPEHPEVTKALQVVDISDLARDPVVRFQSKYYVQMLFLMVFAIPVSLCHWVFPEMSLFHLIVWNCTWYGGSLNATFLVNSIAHIYGDKPYDKYITSADNSWVAGLALGEGWHNYHHTFPWDYKASELGWKINISTMFIDFFAKIGWAYDLKTVSHKLLADRIRRTGDGSHPLYSTTDNNNNNESTKTHETLCWGWGDKELKLEDMEITETLCRKAEPA